MSFFHRSRKALQNIGAGDYGPFDRARRVTTNLLRRTGVLGGGPSRCCGNYGDPGC